MSLFVGRSRLRLVDGLVALYEDVVRGRRPSWVSLEAPSGWGKTRVGRELYARLAARQAEPVYWPAVIDDDSLGRKATHPTRFERPARSLPEFLWWGLACSNRQGLPTEALRRDLAYLETHGLYVEAAWRALTSVRERVGPTLARARRALAEESALELIALGVEQVAGAVVPALGMTARLARWTTRHAVRARGARRSVASATEFGAEEQPDIVDDVVALLGRISGSGFPVVVLVEDAHRADGLLLDLLGKLLHRGGSLMVITTALPDSVEGNTPLVELMRLHERRLHRVTHTAPAGRPFPEGAGLGELEEEARAEILHGFYPSVETTTEAALLRRYVNPWGLELFCQIRAYRVRSRFRTADGALWLPLEERVRLPRGVRGLYERLWDELPPQVQFALAVAHIVTPANINHAAAGGEDRWSEALLREVIGNLAHPDAEDILAALDQAPNAYAWVRLVDDYLRSFAEDFHKDIAGSDGLELLEDELDDVLLERQLDDARQLILTNLAHTLLAAREGQPRTVNRARSILALHAEGYITDHNTTAQAIETLLDDLSHTPAERAERVGLYERFTRLDLAQVSDDIALSIRQHGVEALEQAGQDVKASIATEKLLADQLRVLGPDHPQALSTRRHLGLTRSRQVRDPVAEFEELLADRLRVLGSDHPETLESRGDLAYQLAQAGRGDEAVAVYEELLVDQQRVLGPEDYRSGWTRLEFARLIRARGQVDEAVALYEDVWADRLRVLGSDHPDTLRVREDWADELATAGRGDEAVAVYEELVADRLRVLGPEDFWGSRTRDKLARLFLATGRGDEAVALFEELVAERLRVLGPDHPGTLESRGRLADQLARAGRGDEAVALYEELLADERRVRGPGDDGARFTRSSLARLLRARGRGDEAVALYEEFLADRRRVLGADHPETMQAKRELADELEQGQRIDEAVAVFRELLSDLQRVLGPDDREPREVQTVLARLLANAGRVDEAVAAYQELLLDQQRVVGPDGLGAWIARDELASLLRRHGRADEAVAVYEEFVTDRLRVLGPDHPRTLDARQALARELRNSGGIHDPVLEFEELLADRLRVQGRDHPDTLDARGDLAVELVKAGRVDEAVAVYEELLAGEKRTFGLNHYRTSGTQDRLARLRRIFP